MNVLGQDHVTGVKSKFSYIVKIINNYVIHLPPFYGLKKKREQGEEKQSKASKYISYYYSLLGSLHDYIVPTTDIIVIS